MKVSRAGLIILLSGLLAGLYLFTRRHGNGPAPDKTRVMLIGIDGATWKVIDPLLQAGKLPHIGALMRNGTYGKIKTLDGQVSPVIWTSIATGKCPAGRERPAGHRIYHFTLYNEKLKKDLPARSFDRKAKAVWNILSENNRRVGIFNWLITYPPEKVNGVMVSDYYVSDSPDMVTVYPASLKALLPVPGRKEYPEADRYLNGEVNRLSLDVTVSCFLHEQERSCDLFAVYTSVLDHLQHRFWKYHEPGYFRDPQWNLTEEGIASYKDVIREGYEQVDAWIGRLLENVDGNTAVMVVSDHGFKYAALKDYPVVTIQKIARKIGAADVETRDERGITYVRTTMPLDKFRAWVSGITTVQGEKMYEIIPSDRKEFMLALKRRPVRFDNEYIVVDSKRYPKKMFDEGYADFSGTHDYDDGIFIFSGNHIAKKGREEPDVSVLDIVPTLLYLLDLPVARDMDGKVLTTIVEKKYVRRHPVRYIATYENGQTKEPSDNPATPYDEELIKKLKTLGYIQ